MVGPCTEIFELLVGATGLEHATSSAQHVQESSAAFRQRPRTASLFRFSHRALSKNVRAHSLVPAH